MEPKAICVFLQSRKGKNHASDLLSKWTTTIVCRERILFKDSTFLMQNIPTYMVEAPAVPPHYVLLAERGAHEQRGGGGGHPGGLQRAQAGGGSARLSGSVAAACDCGWPYQDPLRDLLAAEISSRHYRAPVAARAAFPRHQDSRPARLVSAQESVPGQDHGAGESRSNIGGADDAILARVRSAPGRRVTRTE